MHLHQLLCSRLGQELLSPSRNDRKDETHVKKTYEAPKAEKLEFNYEETVAASGSVFIANKNRNKGCSTNGSNGNGRGCKKN